MIHLTKHASIIRTLHTYTHIHIHTRPTLNLKPTHKFSIANHMKTFTPDQLSLHHGRTRIDQNAKLFDNPAKIQEFVGRENELFGAWSEKWARRTREYMDRVNMRRDERTSSTAQIFNGYEYYTTVNWYEQRQYTLIWRKTLHNPSAPPQLVLDIMKYPQLRTHHKTIELTRTVFSPCSKYIAFGFDLHNNEQVSFMIRNIAKNQIVGIRGWKDNRLRGVDNLVFGAEGIFYTKVENFRPVELWYQDFRSGQVQSVYRENNGEYYLDISMAKDNVHLIINSNSKQHSRIWTINTNLLSNNKNTQNKRLKSAMKQFKLGKNNTKTYINHNGKNFVIWRENEQSSQVLLMQQTSNKQKILIKIDPSSNETITDIDIFSNSVVLYIRKIVSPVIRIIHLNDQGAQKIQQIQMPYSFGTVNPGANQMLHTNSFLFYLNNTFVYNQGYEYNFDTKKITIKQQFKMTGPKFNVKDYIVTLHQVPAHDGQLIPLTTIVPKRNRKNRNKMLLHCYGHYGIAYEVSFNNTYWAALQSGWSLAYAHVRGGGEKGIAWHKKAIKGQKYRNWFDLQDCIAYLIKNQYTHPNILILLSHSAGSITIWNTINRFPHLYKAVVMSYPFLDVLGSLLDSSKPLTQSDYAQFGNPTSSLKTYNQIQSYSPYQNIQSDKKYPFIYLVAGTKDYRCPLDQIAKFVKRFRSVRTWDSQKQRIYQVGEKGLLVKINEGSHEGLADLGDQLKDGCQMLACMDYIVEQASKDLVVKK